MVAVIECKITKTQRQGKLFRRIEECLGMGQGWWVITARRVGQVTEGKSGTGRRTDRVIGKVRVGVGKGGGLNRHDNVSFACV